jgi:hypothetical protein
MSPVGFYGGSQTGYCPKNSQQRLPAPQVGPKAADPPVQFGLAAASAYVADHAWKILFYNAIRGIIGEVEALPEPDTLLEGDKKFSVAKNYENLSKRAREEKAKKECLKQAQKNYIDAVATQDYQILKAACWMCAARCAKAENNDPGIVDGLCENAGDAFEASRDEILKERAELMTPYKLTNLVQLAFSSATILPVLAVIYNCSDPNGDWAKKARAYFIKFSFGQDELARVQRNEQLAERFNAAKDPADPEDPTDMKGLLTKISNLHSDGRRWEFDESQAIPTKIPLPLSSLASFSWRGIGSRLKQAVCKSIVPHTPKDTQKDPEDMV